MDQKDKNTQSLWLSTAPLPTFSPQDGDISTDVLIIGGGLAGLLCAFFLRRAGVNCVVIEADTICSGVTGGTTAKITSQHGLFCHKLLRRFGAERARLYLEANQAAVAQYRDLCSSIDCDFAEADSYVYSTDHPEKLDEELSALQSLGFPAEYTADLPLPFSTAGAVRFPRQARFHPLKFVSSFARDLNILEHTRALSYDGQAVVTDRGRITASKIVVCTHFPLFNKHGSYFIKLYQSRSYVLALEGPPYLSGMYVDEADKGLSFRSHENLLLLGGGGHRTGKPGGGWAELARFAQTYYPDAREQFRWAAQDCMTLDGIPYIGPYSARTPDLLVATGFNKWGITSSMVAAILLTDLVRERENPWASVFTPSRTMLRPQLLVNSAESALHLVTPTVPRCPHMGCALKWNPQEQSWDCPCHGSRFTGGGELLDNPANGGLIRHNRE